MHKTYPDKNIMTNTQTIECDQITSDITFNNIGICAPVLPLYDFAKTIDGKLIFNV